MYNRRPPAEAAAYLAYLDSVLSKSKPPHSFSLPTSPRPGRIEDLLMQRHRQAQNHLYMLKAVHQSHELKELRPVPIINPVSKRLAEGMKRPPLVPHTETQTAEKVRDVTKDTEWKETSEVKSAQPPPLELKCHVSLESGTISPVIPTVNPRKGINLATASGMVSLDSLRRRVMEKYEKPELEPPPDLLDMEVLERQRYFAERREKKLTKERLLKSQEETRVCTFRPVLSSPRSLLSSRSERSLRSLSASRSQRSYYERYMHSKSLKSSLNHTTSNVKSSSSKELSKRSKHSALVLTYQPLSPATHRLAFRAGLNLNAFLATAKPMVNYQEADLERAKRAPRQSREKRRH